MFTYSLAKKVQKPQWRRHTGNTHNHVILMFTP